MTKEEYEINIEPNTVTNTVVLREVASNAVKEVNNRIKIYEETPERGEQLLIGQIDFNYSALKFLWNNLDSINPADSKLYFNNLLEAQELAHEYIGKILKQRSQEYIKNLGAKP